MIRRRVGLRILLILAATNFLIILYFWSQISGQQLMLGGGNTLIVLGRLCGLIAMLLVLGQFLMISRIRWLESLVGFDAITRYHRANGKTLVFLIVAHPILLVLGYSQLTGLGLIEQDLALWQQPFVLWAVAAWCLIVTLVVMAAVGFIRRRLSYEVWHMTHLGMYLAIALVFWHQISNGADLLANPVFRYYWYSLYIVAFGSLIYWRLAKPLYQTFNHQFVITRVVPGPGPSTSVYVGGKNIDQFKYKPGQFNMWVFIQKGFPLQKHPFTISIEPNGKEIRLTGKAIGDFTKHLPELKARAKVYIEGPYGIFTPDLSSNQKILLIAGGAGITPLRAMLPGLIEQGRDVKLLYGNKTETDTMLLDELTDLAKSPNFDFTNILSEDPNASIQGHIDGQMIKRLAPDFKERDIYLCGPPLMMDAVTQDLLKLEFPKERIFSERFSL